MYPISLLKIMVIFIMCYDDIGGRGGGEEKEKTERKETEKERRRRISRRERSRLFLCFF